jgi:hypothetical protein
MAVRQLLPKLNPLASATHAALGGLTFAVGAGVLDQSVHAQDEPGAESINRNYWIPAGPPVQLAQAEQVYLDIPPQPLADALENSLRRRASKCGTLPPRLTRDLSALWERIRRQKHCGYCCPAPV